MGLPFGPNGKGSAFGAGAELVLGGHEEIRNRIENYRSLVIAFPPRLQESQLETVQTAPDRPYRTCENCGRPLQGRPPVACSDKCRALVWRQGRQAARAERDRQIRDLLRAALALLEREGG